MKYCNINKFKIDFNINNIFCSFSIVKFTTSENYIKYGALVLDEVALSLKARSIVFEFGKSFYALFDKKIIDKVDLSKQLEKIENGDSLSFKILDSKEIELLPHHTLAQLLINSISNPKHNRLSFNNLTGKLYLFNPYYFNISNKNNQEQIFKIVALELNISRDLFFQLDVKTFSCILLQKQMVFGNRKINEYPKYTFVHSTKTLRRVLNSEKLNGENQYILKQTSKRGKLEKSNIPFLNFQNIDEFNNSKIGMFNSILLSIKEKLSDYLKIEILPINIEKTIRYSTEFKINDFQENVTLIDLAKDSTETITKVQKELKNIIPKSKVKIGKRINTSGYNLKLVHNKAFYEKYQIKDPYKADHLSQHLTIEDFKTNSKASLKALISESIIKNDITNNKISIVDWKKYNYQDKWIFGNKINEHIYFLTIYPNGTLNFEEFESDLFKQDEYNMLCKIFDDNSMIEFIVKDDLGNINAIKRTNNYTIPKFRFIYDILKSESEKLKLSKSEAIKYLRDVIQGTEKQCIIEQRISSVENWNKESLLSCFDNRNDKKLFSEKIKNETGEILKSYLRDKTRYEILDSQLDIHLLKNENRIFYYVGEKGEGIQQQIIRASVIREIEPQKDSELIFDKLLPLMNVDFVKNGNLTVMPFPLKYLRECINVLDTTKAHKT